MRGSTAGLEDTIRAKNKLHAATLETLDTLYAALIVAPCVVGYWRGTWNLMGIYLFPGHPTYSSIASLIIGIVGHLVFTIGKDFFRHNFHPDHHRLTFYVGSRVYTSIFGVVCVNGWRGGWQLIDLYTTQDVRIIIIITVTCLLMMAALRTLRNISAPPFVVVTDHSSEYFDVPTMFKQTVRHFCY